MLKRRIRKQQKHAYNEKKKKIESKHVGKGKPDIKKRDLTKPR